MPQNITPLIYYSIAGLKRRIEDNFDVSPLIETESQLRSRLQSQNTVLAYPIGYLTLTRTQVSNEGHRANKLGAQSGIIGERQDDDTAIKLQALPVRLDIEFNFLTDSFERMLTFTAQWMHASQKNRLNFAFEYYGIDFDNAVLLEPELSLPKKDSLLSDNPDFYQHVGTMTLVTYMTNEDSRDIQQAALINTVNRDLVLVNTQP